jgi:hypothetical protein
VVNLELSWLTLACLLDGAANTGNGTGHDGAGDTGRGPGAHDGAGNTGRRAGAHDGASDAGSGPGLDGAGDAGGGLVEHFEERLGGLGKSVVCLVVMIGMFLGGEEMVRWEDDGIYAILEPRVVALGCCLGLL